MNRMKFYSLCFISISVIALLSVQNTFAQDKNKNQMVRLAKLVIDANRLESYKAFLREEIEASLRVEAGVKTLYAVSEKNNPSHITILEIYADTLAYQAHLKTSHFIKYKTATKDMVKSLELAETVPLISDLKIK